MSLLEDRIIRIIELRKSGCSVEDISSELKIDASLVESYEAQTKGLIERAIERGASRVEHISNRVALSPITVSLFVSQYHIDIVSRATQTKGNDQDNPDISGYGTKARTLDAIKEFVAQGVTSCKTIGVALGKSQRTIYVYGHSAGIKGLSLKSETKRKSSLEETVEAIRKFVAEGETSYEAIAEKLGKKPATVRNYARSAGIKSLRYTKVAKKHISPQEGIEIVKRFYAEGVTSCAEIGARIGKRPMTVYRYARAADVPLVLFEGRRKNKRVSSKNRKKEESFAQIRQALSEGVTTVEALQEKVGLAGVTIINYAREAGIVLPEGSFSEALRLVGKRNLEDRMNHPEEVVSDERRLTTDALIADGLSIPDIADAAGGTRQAIQQYIMTSGQYSTWKKKRAENKQARISEKQDIRRARTEFVTALKMILVKKVKELSWPEQKAWEYYISFKTDVESGYSFDQLVEIFSRYEKAERDGRVLSLEELSQGVARNIYPSTVGRVFKRVGLHPMYGHLERSTTPKYKKEAMQRAFALDLPSNDIAYFLGMSDYNVSQKFTMTGRRPHVKRLISKRGSIYGKHISYRLASEVYEAVDAGFKKKDICKLVDANVEVVDYALENRGVLQEKIVHALRVMYPDRVIIRPYLSSYDRK
jgi:DNA-binding CsgD family transcriptional regulator/predicted transcriptional regulator